MQLIGVLAVSLSVIAPVAALAMVEDAAGPFFTNNVPEGYKIVDMTWTGALEEGGKEYSFKGTIESVETQIKELNPDWSLLNLVNETSVLESRSDLSKRNQIFPVLCNNRPEGYADSLVIAQGIMYLEGLGRCHIPARACARVSCSWNSAIWACNDNYGDITPACPYLADYARNIINACTVESSVCGSTLCIYQRNARGQQFDTDNYNVIVAGDRC
ncbi:hypothetical protein BJX63DRAFT_437318 [Aspergillus granulosus]|uniref:Secreted protein n=1 Tax=Aspergillus granulosus TaxID=176169 RepID=A0ABR4GVB1_9EURO